MTEIISAPHSHDHDGHAHAPEHSDDDGLLALHAEDLYFGLARKYQKVTEGLPDDTAVIPAYDMLAIKQRLGSKQPVLSDAQEHAVAVDFARQFPALPRSERHEHHDGHAHAGDGCGKSHGPIRKALERLENGALSRVHSQKAKIAVALMFRAGFFAMCPGDDIAAIGLQAYASVSGHQHEHHHDEQHPETNAILPSRPRIAFKRGKAIVTLPLHDLHDEQHQELRPPAPALSQLEELDARSSTNGAEKPARKPRRRLAALGLLAVAAFGGLGADAAPDDPPAATAQTAPQASSNRIELPPLYPQPSYKIELPPLATERSLQPAAIEQAVTPGATQWALAERAIKTADISVTSSRTQTVAAYIAHANVKTNPDPNRIQAGQDIKVPNAALTRQLLAIPR